jgi:hypothetical protein
MLSGKRVYQAARKVAQEMVAMNEFPQTKDGSRLHIDTWAEVQLGEDGAYVEARIWVPEARIHAALIDANS